MINLYKVTHTHSHTHTHTHTHIYISVFKPCFIVYRNPELLNIHFQRCLFPSSDLHKQPVPLSVCLAFSRSWLRDKANFSIFLSLSLLLFLCFFIFIVIYFILSFFLSLILSFLTFFYLFFCHSVNVSVRAIVMQRVQVNRR